MSKFKPGKRELFTYIIAGVATTLVYYSVRFFSRNIIENPVICALLGQMCSILFAFFVYKLWVFQSIGKGLKNLFVEFITFTLGRITMIILDLSVTYFCVKNNYEFFIGLFRLKKIDYGSALFRSFASFIGTPKRFEEFIFSTAVLLVAAVVNYTFSKLIVFKNRQKS